MSLIDRHEQAALHVFTVLEYEVCWRRERGFGAGSLIPLVQHASIPGMAIKKDVLYNYSYVCSMLFIKWKRSEFSHLRMTIRFTLFIP